MTERPLDGVVLAGGGARRLSGVDKPMLDVGGVPLLRRSLDALQRARHVVVVGPQRPEVDTVRWAREEPPGSGPVAALAAGLGALGGASNATLGAFNAPNPAFAPEPAADVAALAGDLAGVTADTVQRLRAAIGTADGAVLVDEAGRRQWLIGVWRGEALESALPEDPAGASMRDTLGVLTVVDVPALPGEAADVDTADDLRRARDAFHSGHTGPRAR